MRSFDTTTVTRIHIPIVLSLLLMFSLPGFCQSAKPAWQGDWEKLIDAANKEGKVTVSIPASPQMRNVLEENFRKRFGLEVEVYTARASSAVRRMSDEFKASALAAKDQMSVKEFWQIENQSEEKLYKVREPAQKFAQTVLK